MTKQARLASSRWVRGVTIVSPESVNESVGCALWKVVNDEMSDCATIDRPDTSGALTVADPPVRPRARCADGNGTLTHLFFGESEHEIARAKAICAKCALAPSCLARALERSEPYGVWGGQLLVDGAVVAVKRGRGRPPKHPRPVLLLSLIHI